MATTVSVYFRDGTEEVFEDVAFDVAGDFLLIQSGNFESGFDALFIPSGSVRRANVNVIPDVEPDEGEAEDTLGGAEIS